MKKFITLLLLSFLTLILVLIVRTFTYQFKKIEKTGDNEVVLTAHLDDFRDTIGRRIERAVPVEYVFQPSAMNSMKKPISAPSKNS